MSFQDKFLFYLQVLSKLEVPRGLGSAMIFIAIDCLDVLQVIKRYDGTYMINKLQKAVDDEEIIYHRVIFQCVVADYGALMSVVKMCPEGMGIELYWGSDLIMKN
jgi:hypothetical protein